MIGHRVRRSRMGLPIDRDESLDAFFLRQRRRVTKQLARVTERIQQAHRQNAICGDRFEFMETRGLRQASAPGVRLPRE